MCPFPSCGRGSSVEERFYSEFIVFSGIGVENGMISHLVSRLNYSGFTKNSLKPLTLPVHQCTISK